MTPELSDAICQFYKDQKGKTPPEAELSFLLACRENSMYGMSIYNAKERGQPVRIGINAHGIGVFTEQLRTHYVVWQSMHQLEYQRKSFTIKLKPGEKEGKNNLVFKLDDEGSAKRCWKTAVDHHTFFRLLQPADKHNSLFSFGSTRRPEGRTLIQAKMASQMFDGTPAAPQMSSARVVSRSPENPTYQAASPVEEGRVIMESTTTRTYHIETREATSPRSDAFDGTTDETSESDKKHKEKPKSKHDTSSSSNSSVEVEERHHILHGETDNTKRNSPERSTAIGTEFATHNDQTTIIKHTNEQTNGWETTESPSTEMSGVLRQPSNLGQTVLPLSSSPNKTDEFVEESETISSKVVTTGNRTVETITYTTIKDGVQHSRVEHRVTVNPSEVDSEAALKRAIAESTGLSSRYQVQGLSVPIHSNE
ncbi:hypothetical protein M3Y94_00590600 [Aphelenchoides besseyi]|nr:hypothetical protein M3Y94_00590600 [Aphelenchoides besseyi]